MIKVSRNRDIGTDIGSAAKRQQAIFNTQHSTCIVFHVTSCGIDGLYKENRLAPQKRFSGPAGQWRRPIEQLSDWILPLRQRCDVAGLWSCTRSSFHGPSAAVSNAKRQARIGTPIQCYRPKSIKVEKQSLSLEWWMPDFLASETGDTQPNWRPRAARPGTSSLLSFSIYTKLIQRKVTRNGNTKRGIGGNRLLLFRYVFCLLKDACII